MDINYQRAESINFLHMWNPQLAGMFGSGVVLKVWIWELE